MLSFLSWMDLLLIFLFISVGFLLSREKNGKNIIILYLIGLFFSEVINFLLKEWIKEPRPHSNSGYKDYGMPSNHAQTAFYIIGYYLLTIIYNFYNYKIETIIEKINKNLILFSLIVIAFAVSCGRLYYRYHTLNQIIIGSIIGLMLGFIFAFISFFVFPKND